MKVKTKLRCGQCGKREMYMSSLKGRSMPWLNIPSLTLTRDFEAPVCQSCGNWALLPGQAKELDRALTLTLCDFYIENSGDKGNES